MRQARKRAGAAMTQTEKRPQDWSAEERFAAVLETQGMSEEQRGAWCRGHGLHSHQLAQWRRDAVAGTRGELPAPEQAQLKRLRQENAALKRDLARKDQALAETTALLVLKKKPSSSGARARTADRARGAAEGAGSGAGGSGGRGTQGAGL
jgi:transposase-like protein